MIDWSDGNYEHIAVELEPVSQLVVGQLGDLTGLEVLDLGCGTGNAALAALRKGARVVGIDPASRLIEVATARARKEGFSLATHVSEAARLPLADDSVDVITSIFAVIFAPDAEVAIKEMLRVLRPGGRIAMTSWLPTGGLADVGMLVRRALMPPTNPSAAGPGPSTPPPAWGDASWVRAFFERHGAEVEIESREMTFVGASPKAWIDREVELHPVWRAAHRAHQGRDAEWKVIYEEMIAALTRFNESKDAMAVRSGYLHITAKSKP